MRKGEVGRWNAEGGMRNSECGLWPFGAIGAYTPEGSGKVEDR